MRQLHLRRILCGARTTLGVLYLDGEAQCFVLEDKYRPPGEAKVPGATCIPCGEYRVRVTHSPRFGVLMPLVEGVPGFTGIRIHPGNTHEDTEGCLLPGMEATLLAPEGPESLALTVAALLPGVSRLVEASVGRSREAYQSLFTKLLAFEAAQEEVSLLVTLGALP